MISIIHKTVILPKKLLKLQVSQDIVQTKSRKWTQVRVRIDLIVSSKLDFLVLHVIFLIKLSIIEVEVMLIKHDKSTTKGIGYCTFKRTMNLLNNWLFASLLLHHRTHPSEVHDDTESI